MPVVAEIVDFDSLWQTVAAALVSAVGVVALFSLAVLGGVRFENHRLGGQPLRAALWGSLGLLGIAGSLAAVAVGVIVMANK